MNKIASENDIDVVSESAGMFAEAGAEASVEAQEVMKQYDIDLSGHRARQITQQLIDESDIILTMTEGHRMLLGSGAEDKVFTIAEYAGLSGDVSDPFGGDLEEYEQTALEIYDLLTEIAERIVDNDE